MHYLQSVLERGCSDGRQLSTDWWQRTVYVFTLLRFRLALTSPCTLPVAPAFGGGQPICEICGGLAGHMPNGGKRHAGLCLI